MKTYYINTASTETSLIFNIEWGKIELIGNIRLTSLRVYVILFITSWGLFILICLVFIYENVLKGIAEGKAKVYRKIVEWECHRKVAEVTGVIRRIKLLPYTQLTGFQSIGAVRKPHR